MTTFEGKRIVITGASMGIGAELAVALSARGGRVVVAARTAQALDEVVGRCRPGTAFSAACDVTRQADCQALVQTALEKLGGLDMLVHNAGVSMRKRFDEVEDLAIFEQLMRVNYLGPVWLTHYALPALKQSRGLIVAVSSVTGLLGTPTRTGYAASKHALQGFFDSLRIELFGSGVDVLVVCPGPVATGIRTRALGATVAVDAEEEGKMMTVAECNDIILEAMATRRREVVMGAAARFARVLRLVAPRAVDRRMAAKVKKFSPS